MPKERRGGLRDGGSERESNNGFSQGDVAVYTVELRRQHLRFRTREAG